MRNCVGVFVDNLDSRRAVYLDHNNNKLHGNSLHYFIRFRVDKQI